MGTSTVLALLGSLVPSWMAVGGFTASCLLLLILLVVYFYPVREWTLAFRNIRGPRPTNFFWGNTRDIINAPPLVLHKRWFDEYGPTLRYRIVLGRPRLATVDLTAIGYILQHTYDFPKLERSATSLSRILGNGLLIAEGAVHRRQRRVLNPAFGPSAVRDMMPVFYDKSYELQRKLMCLIEDETFPEKPSPTPAVPIDQVKGARKIDVMKYLAQTTLDVIGLAGFGYDFDSLSDEKPKDLARAFRRSFTAGMQKSPINILRNFFPIFDYVPSQSLRAIDAAREAILEIAKKIVDEKKQVIDAQFHGEVEKGSDIGTDLLSLLMRANMAADLRPDQKLSDEEVMAQVTTFILAGNETSSTALTWCLSRLVHHQDIQDKLRQECLQLDERPTMEELNALPYLEKVVRETLRIDAPVPNIMRESRIDQVIPLAEPVVGRDGKSIESVSVKKGDTVFIPLQLVNRSTELWGPDANEFNPDRYDRPGMPGQNVPGVYANLLTFTGGARNCIGYRFAVAEIKAILYVLIRSFIFEELPSKPILEGKVSIVMRPWVIGEEDAGLQMPLLVRPYTE